MISSEYGWTTDQIMNLTFHEINWRVETIVKRKNAKAKFEMSIHGMNYGEVEQEKHVPLTPKQQKDHDKALSEAMERKAKEWQNKR